MLTGDGEPAGHDMTVDDAAVGIRAEPDVDPAAVRALFGQTEWASQRSVEEIRALLAASAVVVTAWDGDRLVGFARALSDGRFRALVEDVIVDAEVRGRGIGRRLVDAVLDHPRMRKVELVVLSTAIPDFYRPFGFEPDPHAMQRLRRER